MTRRCVGGRPLVEADFVPGAPGSDLSDHDRLELAKFRAYLERKATGAPDAYRTIYGPPTATEAASEGYGGLEAGIVPGPRR